MCACANVLNFKYRPLKMFPLKLRSELQNLIKKFQPFCRCKQNAKKYYTFVIQSQHLYVLAINLIMGLPDINSPFKISRGLLHC